MTQKTKTIQRVLFGIVICIFITLYIVFTRNKDPYIDTRFDRFISHATFKKTHEDSILCQFSISEGSHTNLKKIILEKMHDPKSFIHYKTERWDWGNYINVKTYYGGTNAYGGKVRGYQLGRFYINGDLVSIPSKETGDNIGVKDISEEQFGDKWPFKVKSGRLICVQYYEDGIDPKFLKGVVFVVYGNNGWGTKYLWYALNEAAKTHAESNYIINHKQIMKEDADATEMVKLGLSLAVI